MPTTPARCSAPSTAAAATPTRTSPGIALWNLTRLAECLLPLLGDGEEEALAAGRDAVAAFAPAYLAAHLDNFRSKLGLAVPRDGDDALVQGLLDGMAAGKADFTLTFRRLCDAAADPALDRNVRNLFIDPTAYDAWAEDWRSRLGLEALDGNVRRDAMRAVNPAYIPRNHRVEEVIEAAIARDDFEPFERLGTILARPFDDQPESLPYAEPPAFDTSGYRTFCGT